MHELGIVLSIADKVMEIAEANQLTEIKAITMQIGEISSVIPDYLKKCFPAAVERSPLFENTELKIEILPARYTCAMSAVNPSVLRNSEKPADVLPVWKNSFWNC